MERKFDNLVLFHEDVPFLEDLENVLFTPEFLVDWRALYFKASLGYSILKRFMHACARQSRPSLKKYEFTKVSTFQRQKES